MKSGFLSSPVLAVPATARPGITLDELNALRRLAQAATNRALRHDAQPGNATREWIEKSEKLHALADSTFEAFRLAYCAPPSPNPDAETKAWLARRLARYLTIDLWQRDELVRLRDSL